ncbi:MAG: hypothetical protein IJW70_09800 [Clostridia bacterium]|nr:hypothetical protein [Clostridia bacterium]
MKKALNIVFTSIFTVSYAVLLGLGTECFLTIFGMLLAAATFGGKPLIEEYPRLVPFCVLVGFLALIAIIVLCALNFFIARELKSTAITWIIEIVCSLALSVPMLMLWHMVIEYLRITY